MVTMKFGFYEALPILLPCEIHSFFLTHLVLWRGPVQVSARTLAILTQVSHGFSQSLKKCLILAMAPSLQILSNLSVILPSSAINPGYYKGSLNSPQNKSKKYEEDMYNILGCNIM
jgi:hypothetical protein